MRMKGNLKKIACVFSVFVMIATTFSAAVNATETPQESSTAGEEEIVAELNAEDNTIEEVVPLPVANGISDPKDVLKEPEEATAQEDYSVNDDLEIINEPELEDNEASESSPVEEEGDEEVSQEPHFLDLGNDAVKVDALEESEAHGVTVGINYNGESRANPTINPADPPVLVEGGIDRYFEIDASSMDSFSGVIQISYEEDALPPDISEESLALFYLDDSMWRIVSNASLGEETGVDTENNIVWGKTTNSGTFGIGGYSESPLALLPDIVVDDLQWTGNNVDGAGDITYYAYVVNLGASVSSIQVTFEQYREFCWRDSNNVRHCEWDWNRIEKPVTIYGNSGTASVTTQATAGKMIRAKAPYWPQGTVLA
jgi:hypothetical protein